MIQMVEIWLLVAICMQLCFPVLSQNDTNPPGFLSINCGVNDGEIQDTATNLIYISDAQYVESGVPGRVSDEYASQLQEKFRTLRSFPEGTFNCYMLNNLTAGQKYLVRATFLYGNYDGKGYSEIPFDLYLDGIYWTTFSISTNDWATPYFYEVLTVSRTSYMSVCLKKTSEVTPFISVLELRHLNQTMYPVVNLSSSLIFLRRMNMGGSQDIRYPHDPYDRIWYSNVSYIETNQSWTKLSTDSPIVNQDGDIFQFPNSVMQTAVSPTNIENTLDFSFKWYTNQLIYVCMGFAAFDSTKSTKFIAQLNGENISNIFNLQYLESDYLYNTDPFKYTTYELSLVPTSDSGYVPVLNAVEFYSSINSGHPEQRTDTEDFYALMSIKRQYNVKKNWMGDPCLPRTVGTWYGITCNYNTSGGTVIQKLNLSSSDLAGEINASFGNLTSIDTLDLSNNSLSGHLPDFLDQLSALIYLDITGNSDLSTTLPLALQTKYQNGGLTYRFDTSGSNKSKKSSVPIIVGVVVTVLLLITAVISTVICIKRRKKNRISIPKPVESNGSTPLANRYASGGQNYANKSEENGVDEMLNFENRQFNYNDIMNITDNFQNDIGTGGFGSVYMGILENGTQVAVKIRSHSSSQGVKEFLAEAQNLTRVHHKNLVLLLGYCMDRDCMALVYEYMQGGTLQDKLRDNGMPLTWKQRLQIAHESAQGLEYLHKACNPPLIHRDVKTNNILLNANLVAKIADFGLSRAFNSASSHVSTAVVGTPGYLDPEYYSSYQLSEKSDVFSFGVVLLEIITGKPHIIPGADGGHVVKWASKKLSRGDIESIVDPQMHGQYDINSVWKVTELALKCTELSSSQRPTMSEAVSELKESLDLEISTEGTRTGGSTSTDQSNSKRNDNYTSDVSQNSTFEIAYMELEGMPSAGPAAR